jgi:hypothetical protein
MTLTPEDFLAAARVVGESGDHFEPARRGFWRGLRAL